MERQKQRWLKGGTSDWKWLSGVGGGSIDGKMRYWRLWRTFFHLAMPMTIGHWGWIERRKRGESASTDHLSTSDIWFSSTYMHTGPQQDSGFNINQSSK